MEPAKLQLQIASKTQIINTKLEYKKVIRKEMIYIKDNSMYQTAERHLYSAETVHMVHGWEREHRSSKLEARLHKSTYLVKNPDPISHKDLLSA